MQAVLVAGGTGSRMVATHGHLPKCLIQIGGRSILEHCFASLSQTNVQLVTLLLAHQAEEIKLEAERLALQYGLKVEFSVQNQLLGTGGSVIAALDQLEESFLLLYGDLFLSTDLNEICNIENEGDVDFAQIVHPSSHMFDSDIVEIDHNSTIIRYHTKPHPQDLFVRNLCNSGIYFFRKIVFQNFETYKKYDLDRELLPKILNLGYRGRALRHIGVIKDAGTPKRLEELEKFVSKNTRGTKRSRAVFLDRDGTFIREDGYLVDVENLELFTDSPKMIKKCNELGLLTLVVTNQPAIARGLISELDLCKIHNHIDMTLARADAWIDEYYFCPHHPDSGFLGEIPELKKYCDCRKPKTELIERAIRFWNIEIEQSIMIGNSWRDREAANSLGIRYFEVHGNSHSLGSAADSDGVSFTDWLIEQD
jgi:D,D-heptose 1,7-bisphosphate phosphatase